MDRVLDLLRIRSGRTIVLLTIALTILCVAAPVLSLASLFAFMPWIPGHIYWGILAVAAAIPLIIAPPIAVIGLSMLRLLTSTVERIDEHVKYDPLTRVLTRSYLLQRVREVLADGGAFLMVDADHFKSINDTYGHDVGDQALQHLARSLQQSLPRTAIVGRLGGEEFGIFLPRADATAAAAVATALCADVRRDGKTIFGHDIGLTVSIGAAVFSPKLSLEATMKHADEALYQAKHSGRDRYFVAGAGATMPALLLRAAVRRA